MIGSGTVLDTARLKERLGEHLEVDSRSVHAFIVGEHGDSEIAAWSSANVSGIPLHDFCEMRGHHDHEGATSEIAEKVKNSAYEIIQRKGATYYGIAMSVKRICEAIIRDERSILQISTMMDGEYGIKDVVLSMPSIVGAEGFISKVPISLSEDEIKALHKSAETLKSVLKSHTAYLAKGMGSSPFFYSKSFIFLSLTSIRFSSCIRPSSLDSALRFTPKNSASAVCVKGTWRYPSESGAKLCK